MAKAKIDILAQGIPTLTYSVINVGEAERIRMVTETNQKKKKKQVLMTQKEAPTAIQQLITGYKMQAGTERLHQVINTEKY